MGAGNGIIVTGDDAEDTELGPLATTVIEYVVPEDRFVKSMVVLDP
jgi:hypothetical protein